MKTSRKLFLLAVTFLCVAAIAMPAFAASLLPMSDDTIKCETTLTINSRGMASCSADARSASIYHQVTIDMHLYRIGDSLPLKTWSTTGDYVAAISKNYYVTKGHDYQVTADITIKDSNGNFIESFPVSSAIVHY